ncbi:hypothetical protein DUT91_22740 [Phyllobacterium salinisoli]|uniref:PNPLA domain-containing protein n=1 Tax=Phyllobacterium salinisoli TaxID=1899321 RepID=A0A368JWT5_9HYPH|nr:patatin-like phospholipase family protein [Phyllobacterium salinisoli]RCS21628.1 hypothetical protein DUT91_22740 [Phyllobacterium salinisoli]
MTNRKLSSVLSLIEERRREHSKPSERKDVRFVALVVEGGAMRGVVSGGMVSALEQLELTNSIDAVYGSSAGAIAGAYFIAGQATYGTTIYYENINNSNFIDITRGFVGKSVVSLEYLLDDVCVHQKPLDCDAIIKSPIELNVVAASLSAQKAIILKKFKSGEELRTALKGSSRIPFFAGSPVEWNGDRLLDASLYESIPYKQALADPRVTDILVLLTRPKGNLRSAPGFVDKYFVIPYLRKLSPIIADHYSKREVDYKDELDELASLSVETEGGKNVFMIQLASTDIKVSSLEKSRKKLVQGAVSGFKAVYNSFGYQADEFIEVIVPYRQHRTLV